jgi:hypothetical protein
MEGYRAACGCCRRLPFYREVLKKPAIQALQSSMLKKVMLLEPAESGCA